MNQADNSQYMQLRIVTIASLLFGALILGCNSGHEGLIPVRGTVTFDGGPPPKAGIVQFHPVETPEGGIKRTAIGKFDEEGRYLASSFAPDDGLYPGKYAVKVVCNKPAPDEGHPPGSSPSFIADDYKGTELVVEAGDDDITFDIDVPLKKN